MISQFKVRHSQNNSYLVDHSLSQCCLAASGRTSNEIKESGRGLLTAVHELPQCRAVFFPLHIDGWPLMHHG